MPDISKMDLSVYDKNRPSSTIEMSTVKIHSLLKKDFKDECKYADRTGKIIPVELIPNLTKFGYSSTNVWGGIGIYRELNCVRSLHEVGFTHIVVLPKELAVNCCEISLDFPLHSHSKYII